MSASPIITAEAVCFAYARGPRVLHDVSITAQAGALHAIVGPNASGKTTLLRLMLGQLTPLAGQVRIDGKRADTMPARARARRLAYMPQRSATSFAFTVQQVVAMGRFAVGDDAASVDRAIADVDLTDAAGRPYLELSAGQQQRVLLARALAQVAGSGGAMLLDEPTSALDLAHAHRVMRRLRALAHDGLAVVVILHDLNLAARYADRATLLHEGRVVADGPRQQVLTRQQLEPVYGVRLAEMQPAASAANPYIVFDVQSPIVEPPGLDDE